MESPSPDSPPGADSDSDSDSRRMVRNICILAHVDHGKTTLADHLIASCGGGVLHPKLAGRVRFMDFLDEEQRRAITMKSSSIALSFRSYLINLIDSPGHIDFCSEVSSAARASDGVLLLVDAVEGVHIQTHAALKQAWQEKLTPCLVLNKIDRLITELKLSEYEAYERLLRIVREVNSIVSRLKSQQYFTEVDSVLNAASGDTEMGAEKELNEEEDNEDMFQPEKGNVVFACSLDGWGFRIEEFAEFYAKKMGASVSALMKGLWGPRFYNTKKKMIVGMKGAEGREPMFVQFVLKQLWQVYHAALSESGDRSVLEKLVKNFNLSVPAREMQNKDPKAVLQSVMSRWLPLSDAVLSMVVKCVPDPRIAQSLRIARLIPEVKELSPEDASSDVIAEAERVRKCVQTCDASPDAPCVVFVSKMFAVPFKMLPSKGPNGESLRNLPVSEGEADECFLAFARVFSGVIRPGQKVFVLSSLYDPLKSESSMQRHIQEGELQALYQMMGQGLKPLAEASAGNVVAIQGLGQHILKSGTLSATRNCWPIAGMMFQVTPILKVAIEPSDPSHMGALARGLRLLNRADPFVEITESSKGEHVLAAAGEVHLERCIKDLTERFAKIKLVVSPPLVSFKETIEGEGLSLVDSLKTPPEIVVKWTPNGKCVVRVQAVKLPLSLIKALEENADILGDIIKGRSDRRIGGSYPLTSGDDADSVATLRKRLMDAIESELDALPGQLDKEKVDKYRNLWHNYLRRMWSLGPRQVGPNILLMPDGEANDVFTSADNKRGILIRGSCDVSRRLGFIDDSDAGTSNHSCNLKSSPCESESQLYQKIEALKISIVSGFQLATAAGPLCDEPMWGLGFIVEPHIIVDGSEESDQSSSLDGQMLAVVKEACRAAVLQNKPRLVEAMYFCELNTPFEQLGSTNGVLKKRRAKVIDNEMNEGYASMHAYLPLAESFGFPDELRERTSAAASALLVFSHWETNPEDPFFVPKTEEEIEEFGDGSSVPHNTARKLIDSVRRRKGLPVEEKVVEHATKQRTRARKV